MKTSKFVQCASVDARLPEEAAREVDQLVKELPAECRAVRRKAVAEKSDTDPTSRTDVSYVSTPATDHEKEVVMNGGVDLSVYERNKIVLFQHDQNQPCGKCLWIKDDGKGILAKTYYPEKPEKYDGGEWLPERVWGLVQAEILRGKSITFLPLEVGEPDEAQKAAGAEVIFPRSLLLEYSVVALPCCPEALVQAVEKKLDLALLGIKKTGQRIKKRTRRIEYRDRTPEFLKAMEELSMDPAEIADRVYKAMANRGKI